MARTAPVPNIPAPPGMNPGAFVAGGGGDGGGAGGKGGKNGNGKEGAGTEDGDADASGDGNDGGCAEGDPICPITGRMFIHFFDFASPGPAALRWLRAYSSRDSDRASELGYGWSHSFSWRVHHRRRRTEVYDDVGRLQLFGGLDARGQIRRNPLGWTLEHAGDSLLLRTRNKDQVLRFGEVDSKGWRSLIGVLDRNGNEISLQRNEKHWLIGMRDSAGRAFRVANDERGRIRSIDVATNAQESAWQRVVSYSYDQNGDLVSVTDAEGYVDAYRYKNHLVTEHITPTGLTYHYRYDGKTSDAWCLESWGAYPGQTDPALAVGQRPPFANGPRRDVKGINWVRFTYDKQNAYTEVENSLGGVTRYFGDPVGRAVRIVAPEGGVWEREFDPDRGVLVAASGPSGSGVDRDVDAEGRVAYEAPIGSKGVARWVDEEGTETTYNELSQQVVQRRYDARGNLTFVRHQDGTWEEFAYDSRGLVTQQIHRNGGRTASEYDGHGNCIRLTHPSGRWESSEYDFLGRRVSYTNHAGEITTWEWDRRGEIVKKRTNDGNEIFVEYDAIRRPLLITDGGKTTRYEYGGVGWLTKVTHPGGQTYQLRYDTDGNRVEVENPRGQRFTLRNDLEGRVIEWTTFEGVRYTKQHGMNGAVEWLSSAVAHTTVETADDGRPLVLEAGDDKIEFSYSPIGLVKLDNGIAVVERELDVFQRLLSEVQGDHQVRLAWLGSALSAVTSDVGPPIGYEQGPDGDVVAVTVGSQRVEKKHPAGPDWVEYLGDRLVRRTTSSVAGVTIRQAVAKGNIHSDLTNLGSPKDASALWWAQYEYDRNRNLVAEHHSDGLRVEYELTPSSQISKKSVSRQGQLLREETYRYDAAGSPIVPGASYDHLMRPTGYHGEKFEYDEVGRLVSRLTDRGEWQYTWNSLDQLILVVAPGKRVEMDYDASSRRLRKRVIENGTLVKQEGYIWANNVVLHEVNELTGAVRTYLWDHSSWDRIGHVDVVDGEERVCFYVLKPAGGISHAIDADGRIVWQAEMSVFGECDPSVSDVPVSLRFANQHYDEDVELIYNRYRWYDPRLGMYVTTDPTFLEGTANPRDYVPNPLRWIDPMGLVAGGATAPSTTPSGGPAPTIDGTAAGAPYLSAPGAFATDGTPGTPGWVDCPANALHQGSGFGSETSTTSAQGIVNRAGDAYGCHSCGTMDSGYDTHYDKDGNPVQHWTCDHQPPRSTYNKTTSSKGGAVGAASNSSAGGAGAVRLYPHCKGCSNKQKTALSAASRAQDGRQNLAVMGLSQMSANQGVAF